MIGCRSRQNKSPTTKAPAKTIATSRKMNMCSFTTGLRKIYRYFVPKTFASVELFPRDLNLTNNEWSEKTNWPVTIIGSALHARYQQIVTRQHPAARLVLIFTYARTSNI